MIDHRILVCMKRYFGIPGVVVPHKKMGKTDLLDRYHIIVVFIVDIANNPNSDHLYLYLYLLRLLKLIKNQLEELHEVTGLGRVRCLDINSELVDMLGLGVKLDGIDDFVNTLAEDGVVDVVVIVVNEPVSKQAHKGGEFVQS
jgi:hypothetical protein